jgi:hypothetical protein
VATDDDRFGMPASAFAAAREAHGVNSPVYRCGTYVPTRGEVATLPIAKLRPILIDWMWESPSELIPDDAQITAVREILLCRSDVEDDVLQALIRECDDFLKI